MPDATQATSAPGAAAPSGCNQNLFTEHNIWRWETTFFVMIFALLAYVRQYTDYLKKNPGKVTVENVCWGVSSFIIVIWVTWWRLLCQPQRAVVATKPGVLGKGDTIGKKQQDTQFGKRQLLTVTRPNQQAKVQTQGRAEEKIYWWPNSIAIACIVALGAFLIGYVIEIGGLNTLVYLKTKPAPTCTNVNEDYEAADKSWDDVTMIGLGYMFMFIFVTCAIFLLTCHRTGFLDHYYENTTGESKSYLVFRWVWGLLVKVMVFVFNLIIAVVYTVWSLVRLFLVSPLYRLGTGEWLKGNYWETMDSFRVQWIRNLWWDCNNLKDKSGTTIEKGCRFTGAASFFLGYNTTSYLTSWMIELVVGGIIFALPAFLVIQHRLELKTIGESFKDSEARMEFALLFIKYVAVLGLKMMLEYYLSKTDGHSTPSAAAPQGQRKQGGGTTQNATKISG